MTTNYNIIADMYKKTKTNLLRKYVEEFSVLKIVGEVQDQLVLDLACGDGHYSRMFKQMGAASVTGVDVSEMMIQRALEQEQQATLGIVYQMQDVAQLGQIGRFDLVTAVYLFPYANTRQMLQAMCCTISANLKLGGRLISALLNPTLQTQDLHIYKNYGVSISTPDELTNGVPVTAMLDSAEGMLELSAYFWDEATYETALQQAGFSQIKWYPMQVSEVGLTAYGYDYWHDFVAKPLDVILECVK